MQGHKQAKRSLMCVWLVGCCGDCCCRRLDRWWWWSVCSLVTVAARAHTLVLLG